MLRVELRRVNATDFVDGHSPLLDELPGRISRIPREERFVTSASEMREGGPRRMILGHRCWCSDRVRSPNEQRKQ